MRLRLVPPYRFAAALLAAAALSASAPATAAAQPPSAERGEVGLVPGQRVRLTLPSARDTVGTVVALTPDSLRVQWARTGDTVTVGLTDVSRLEVSRGQRRRVWEGVGLGLLAGAAAGGTLGALTYREPDCTGEFLCLDFGRGFAAAAGAIVGGVPGALVGGVVGSNHRKDRWREVPLHGAGRRVGVAVRPSRAGLRLAAVVRF